MKKARLAASILTGLLSVGVLAGCNEVRYSKEGYILTYKANGVTEHYTADDLFKGYITEADKAQTLFDNVYKLIVKNYFKGDSQEIKDLYKSIEELAKRDVDGDKQTARKNAETNGTSYDSEFETILNSHSCKDEAELLQYYIYERESKEFEDRFYDDNTTVLRDGGKLGGSSDYDGYISRMAPYHVSHILVKLEDSSSTNYWNGTISEQNCNNLNRVATYLAEGKNSFGYIANLFSDDEGSKESFGDLGIMDKSTSFVDEFKLGLYAFENLYGYYQEEAAQSSIKMVNPEEYQKFDGSAEGQIGVIPYGVFAKLDEVAKTTKGYSNSSVHSDNSLYYPRNVFYNEFLNKHAVSLIGDVDVEGNKIDTSDLEGFYDYFGDGHKYLCTKYKSVLGEEHDEWKPILAVRAGTDSYQGIHFIVANRSPLELEEDYNGVEMSDYYTTYYPGQKDYPVDENGDDLQTYVNFNNLENADAKSRAESLKSTIKGFDSNLQKEIYKVYKKAGEVEFEDNEYGKLLETSINKWIDASIEKKAFDDEIDWDKKWNNYIANLHQQSNERAKRLPTITGYLYQYVNDPVMETMTLSALLEDKYITIDCINELEERFGDNPVRPEAGWEYATIDDLFNQLGAPCNDGQKH